MHSTCRSGPLFSHINGLALALLLGVDGVILPPAVARHTFNTTWAHLRDDNLWFTRPLDTLLDVERMRVHWREHHGIVVQEVSGGIKCRASPGLYYGLYGLYIDHGHLFLAMQATNAVMTSSGTNYPRALLASARPMGEPSDCVVVHLNVPEFGNITDAAALMRLALNGTHQKRGSRGCIILRTESLFRCFWYKR